MAKRTRGNGDLDVDWYENGLFNWKQLVLRTLKYNNENTNWHRYYDWPLGSRAGEGIKWPDRKAAEELVRDYDERWEAFMDQTVEWPVLPAKGDAAAMKPYRDKWMTLSFWHGGTYYPQKTTAHPHYLHAEMKGSRPENWKHAFKGLFEWVEKEASSSLDKIKSLLEYNDADAEWEPPFDVPAKAREFITEIKAIGGTRPKHAPLPPGWLRVAKPNPPSQKAMEDAKLPNSWDHTFKSAWYGPAFKDWDEVAEKAFENSNGRQEFNMKFAQSNKDAWLIFLGAVTSGSATTNSGQARSAAAAADSEFKLAVTAQRDGNNARRLQQMADNSARRATSPKSKRARTRHPPPSRPPSPSPSSALAPAPALDSEPVPAAPPDIDEEMMEDLVDEEEAEAAAEASTTGRIGHSDGP
tara:strand:+ start:4248 stop:5480 length:1233 start_codon:yes stop_codon:yes gene_type:complete